MLLQEFTAPSLPWWLPIQGLTRLTLLNFSERATELALVAIASREKRQSIQVPRMLTYFLKFRLFNSADSWQIGKWSSAPASDSMPQWPHRTALSTNRPRIRRILPPAMNGPRRRRQIMWRAAESATIEERHHRRNWCGSPNCFAIFSHPPRQSDWVPHNTQPCSVTNHA